MVAENDWHLVKELLKAAKHAFEALWHEFTPTCLELPNVR